MLNDALKLVRMLTDEAIAAEENRHAAALSRLASTLDAATRHCDDVSSKYMPRTQAREHIQRTIADYTMVAKAMLSPTNYATFEQFMQIAIPAAVGPDADVEQLEKELDQVKKLFDLAVKGYQVGEITRLGNLLAVKAKALVRTQIDSGNFATLDDLKGLQDAVVAASHLARDAIGSDVYDPVADAFYARFAETA